MKINLSLLPGFCVFSSPGCWNNSKIRFEHFFFFQFKTRLRIWWHAFWQCKHFSFLVKMEIALKHCENHFEFLWFWWAYICLRTLIKTIIVIVMRAQSAHHSFHLFCIEMSWYANQLFIHFRHRYTLYIYRLECSLWWYSPLFKLSVQYIGHFCNVYGLQNKHSSSSFKCAQFFALKKIPNQF